MTLKLLTAEKAATNGYSKYNGGPHLCVDVPEGNFTISAKTPQGRQITFAFIPAYDSPGHQCIDIHCHNTGKLNSQGVPVQQASVLGSGLTIHVSRYDDDPPATVIALSLREAE